MKNKTAIHRAREVLAILLSLSLLVSACANGPSASRLSERQIKAQAMFAERCRTAGEKIHRTVDSVDGIYLLKVRPKDMNYRDQFSLTDPYGDDLGGDGYIGSFVRGHYEANHAGVPIQGAPLRPAGYLHVEALDAQDGRRYRYTGRIEEPWQTNKSYLKGHMRFVLEKAPASGAAPRYGVTYDDISTREERDYWIAGSSLKVIDLQTNEVIAERRGYMMDLYQGSKAGGRSPWLFAADHACPSFIKDRRPASGPAFAATSYQAARFVEKVLIPKKDQ